MPLTRVRITALRCLEDVELELDARRSYIFGPNGAGKTSILEGIFMLSRGRSFRTRQIRRLIRRGSQGFTVFGEVDRAGRAHRAGVAFAGGRLEKKLDGEPAAGTAALAELLPVHAIDPGVHALVEGEPSERRRFLDWGVFHVEQNYLDAWRRYRRILGQRNATLKGAIDTSALRTWSAALVEAGETIDAARARYVRQLAVSADDLGRALLTEPLSVDYRRGWAEDLSFAEALGRAEARDRQLATTSIGPHRADLVIELGGRRAHAEASRGQQKLAAAALVLGQVVVHAASRGDQGVLLVDDPAAELDRERLERLLEILATIPAQLVLTGLSVEQLRPSGDFPVFHVERGALKAL